MTWVSEKKAEEKSSVWHYFLLTALLSFLGWLFETTVVYFSLGRYSDRGFLTLPFCPIYGVTLLSAYLLLGTPNEGRGILKRVEDPIRRSLLYLLFVFLLPTLAELIVGGIFDRFFKIRLWNYARYPLNYKGYICLPVSLAWAVLIFLFMRLLFPRMKSWISRCPKKFSAALSIVLGVVLIADLILTALHRK